MRMPAVGTPGDVPLCRNPCQHAVAFTARKRCTHADWTV